MNVLTISYKYNFCFLNTQTIEKPWPILFSGASYVNGLRITIIPTYYRKISKVEGVPLANVSFASSEKARSKADGTYHSTIIVKT